MISFVLTADNYPDMLDVPISESVAYSVFFIVTAVLGLFIFTALVISSFEKEFTNQFAQVTKQHKCVSTLHALRSTLITASHGRFNSEKGSIAAFLLMDKDKKGRLTVRKVAKFFNEVLLLLLLSFLSFGHGVIPYPVASTPLCRSASLELASSLPRPTALSCTTSRALTCPLSVCW